MGRPFIEKILNVRVNLRLGEAGQSPGFSFRPSTSDPGEIEPVGTALWKARAGPLQTFSLRPKMCEHLRSLCCVARTSVRFEDAPRGSHECGELGFGLAMAICAGRCAAARFRTMGVSSPRA